MNNKMGSRNISVSNCIESKVLHMRMECSMEFFLAYHFLETRYGDEVT